LLSRRADSCAGKSTGFNIDVVIMPPVL
jgi:hypothetical protein